jgi:hypothetical protein
LDERAINQKKSSNTPEKAVATGVFPINSSFATQSTQPSELFPLTIGAQRTSECKPRSDDDFLEKMLPPSATGKKREMKKQKPVDEVKPAPKPRGRPRKDSSKHPSSSDKSLEDEDDDEEARRIAALTKKKLQYQEQKILDRTGEYEFN